eukprot:TRINITY_DN18582_c0_g1_i1.p3 TRINITY_DN18582_c0_g1~~TRINITY_DN18582_c0_g1_i1.p3  ORF type:complete len:111 (-),score=32.17 TRINITY_DN18582_c0_g1_i1:144-476(-)
MQQKLQENEKKRPSLSTPIDKLLEKRVEVITLDGRILIGQLRGTDQALNIVLQDTIERVFFEAEPTIEKKIGLYMIRGDDISIIGEIDDIIDSKLNYDEIKAAPIKPIQN